MSILKRAEIHFNLIKDWLPAKVSSILDIGSGPAGIDVWLARHYGAIEINLLDGDRHIEAIGKNQVGFRAHTEAWKDRNEGARLVREHAPDCVVKGHPPDPSLTIPADLIVSLRAWGHHFSVETYIGLVERSLRPGGRLILDIRNSTDGLAVLDKHGFISAANISSNSEKCLRYVIERKAKPLNEKRA